MEKGVLATARQYESAKKNSLHGERKYSWVEGSRMKCKKQGGREKEKMRKKKNVREGGEEKGEEKRWKGEKENIIEDRDT